MSQAEETPEEPPLSRPRRPIPLVPTPTLDSGVIDDAGSVPVDDGGPNVDAEAGTAEDSGVPG
jgi:hypothetical protein